MKKTTSNERRLQATIEGLEIQVADLRTALENRTSELGASRTMLKSAEDVASHWRRKYEWLHEAVRGWAVQFKQASHGLFRETQDFSHRVGQLADLVKVKE